MAFLLHVCLTIAYSAIAIAIAVVVPIYLPWFPAQHAPLAGTVVFLAALVLHVTAVQSGRYRVLEEHIRLVRSAYQQLAADVDFAYNESINLREAMADTRKTSAQRVSDMVGEVRVLQRLIERFYGDGGHALPKPGAIGQPEPSAAPVDPPLELDMLADDLPPPAAANPDPAPRERFSRSGTAAGDPPASHAVTMPPIAEDLDDAQVLGILREGLRLDRVDVYLQPIVSLPQRKPRFYECFTRVRAEDGSVVVPEQYIELAQQEGLVTDIDNMLLFRCVQLIRRAQRRTNDNTVFLCNVSQQSLGDTEFFNDFVDFVAENNDLAPMLVFEFRQQDIEHADDDLRDNLRRLAELGFRFSLDQIHHFNMNLAALGRSHFRYIKLDAQHILEHLDNDGSVDDIIQLKRSLDREGIDLIVEKIEREQQLRELLDFKIDFGQGFLFGEPRLSRND